MKNSFPKKKKLTNFFEKNGVTNQWRDDFKSLNEAELIQAKEIIKNNDFSDITQLTDNPKILRALSHYGFLKMDKNVVGAAVKRLRTKYNKLIKNDMFINLTLTHDFDSAARNKIAV